MKQSSAFRAGLLARAGVLSIAVFAALPASAQDAPVSVPQSGPATQPETATDQSPAATASPGTALGDIVVTARKRSESLQSVPIAVQAFSQAQITDKGIVDAQSLELAANSFTLDLLGGTRVRTAIRGLGSDNTSPGQEFSTAMFLDGVPLGTLGMAAVDIYDVDRVEVLKGPQGTLFGKNVIGGLVNVIPAAARVGDNSAFISGTVGAYGELDSTGYVNVTTGSAAHRLAFNEQHHDGYVQNLSGRGDPENENHIGARYSFTLEPQDGFRLTLAADYSRDRSLGRAGYVAGNRPYEPTGVLVTTPRSYTALALHAIDDPRVVNLQNPGFDNRDMYGLRIGTTIALGHGIDLDVIGSIRGINDGYLHNDGGYELTDPVFQRVVDQTVVPGATAPGGRGYELNLGLRDNADQETLEARLSSSGTVLKWTAGLFYSNLDYQQKMDFALNSLNCEGTRSLAAGTCQFVYANDAADAHAVTRDFGAFAEGTWSITPKLSLTGGLRYSYTHKTFWWTNDVPRRTGSVFSGPVVTAPFQDERSWSDVTYKATADYKIRPGVMVYATYATGFKPGGYGGLADSRTLAATSAEKVVSYEAGIKSTFGRFRLNGAVFDMKDNGLQVTQVQAGGGLSQFLSVDYVKVRGAEAEVVWAPTNELTLDVNYTYLDAKLRGFPTAPTTTFVLQRAPEHEVVADARYRPPVSVFGGKLELGATYSYRGKVYDDPDDSSGEIRPPRTLVDAFVSWTNDKGDLSVRAFGRNLTNEVYYNRITDSADGSYANLGAPRTYGVTVGKKF